LEFRGIRRARASGRPRSTRRPPSRGLLRRRSRRAAAARNPRRLRLEQLESRLLLSASPTMVRDINTVDYFSDAGAPGYLTAIGSTLYFAANDGTTGRELWKTDGTKAGTVRVKDIRAGSGSSLSESRTYLRKVRASLFPEVRTQGISPPSARRCISRLTTACRAMNSGSSAMPPSP
jgi:ELWxxDGT repeat protein